MTPHEATEQGLAAHKAGRLSEAEAHYATALKAKPEFHPALHLMGLSRFQQQDYAAALDWFSRAVAAAPGDARSLAARGEALQQLDRQAEALVDFDRVLAADPGLVAIWNNRGLALNALKRHAEALASYERATLLSPGTVELHNNRGDTLRELRRFDEALASFDRALAIKPDDWATLNNRAIALRLMGRTDEALASYDRALALEPNIPAALHARGNLNWGQKSLLGPAIADLERLVKIAPDFPFARGSLMRLKMNAADWDDYDRQKQLLEEGARAGQPVIEPFIHLAVSDKPQDLKAGAELYARTRFPAQPALCVPAWRAPQVRKIRIGYVCGEFRKHATLYLMAGLFEAHDRQAFEIFAFDNGGADDSDLRRRFEAAMANIVDIRQMSDAEAAARIKVAGIDILVDLNGYSGEQRLGVFAHRPAPVQVSWLAYPGTLGAPYMDYILADRVVIADGEEKYFCEKIARLPHSYQINDNKRMVGETPGRASAGLPEEAFVFCNFNHANKFTPQTFTRWLKIVGEAPASVLWLLAPHALAQENLKREAAARGFDPARLVFAESLPFERHLARLKLADLFLDGLPYGAHTTASDALWAGLPLITLRGNSFAGRVAASLLSALEMPELITGNAADFEALALELVRDRKRLADIREKLARQRDLAPLFDTARTTREVETAYRMMLEAPPRHFAVPG